MRVFVGLVALSIALIVGFAVSVSGNFRLAGNPLDDIAAVAIIGLVLVTIGYGLVHGSGTRSVTLLFLAGILLLYSISFVMGGGLPLQGVAMALAVVLAVLAIVEIVRAIRGRTGQRHKPAAEAT